MSGVRRTEDLFSIKTKQIIMQNFDGNFPKQYGVLNIKDERGHVASTDTINLQSLNTVDLSAQNIITDVLHATALNQTPFYKVKDVSLNELVNSYNQLLGLLCGRGLVVDTLVWTTGLIEGGNVLFGGGIGAYTMFDPSTNTFIAVGADVSSGRSAICFSTDGGVEWNYARRSAAPSQTFTNFTSCYDVAFVPTITANGRFIATGSDPSGMNITITGGATPTTWRTDISGIPFGVGGYGKVIAFSPTRIVVGGRGVFNGDTSTARANICCSDETDGVNWVDAIGTPFGNNPAVSDTVCMCNDILYDPSANVFIAVGKERGNNTNICTSTNGRNWVDVSGIPFGYEGQGNSIAKGPVYVAGGQGDSTILYSSNRTTWIPAIGAPFDNSGTCNKVVFLSSANRFFALGQGKNGRSNICFSTNGATWSDTSGSPFGVGGYGTDIVYNPPTKRFIASGSGVGGRANICYSNDGVTWNDVNAGSDGEIVNPFGLGGVANAFAYNSTTDTIVTVGGGLISDSSIYYS